MDSTSTPNSSPLSYSSLEWRFQTQIASRSARDQLKPQILLKFWLSDERDNKKSVSLVCSADQLVHLQDLMEEALIAARSQHLLKTVRRVK